ncbi:hypothetical protein [Rugamonas sp.]|uniref:hypothetical protein n=1 Tax=Rugamonas sp. TaxID=1926287 RepID=UPI0025FB73E3|nr:hypothetical protein [Rugamonas sp.]
MEKMVWHYAPWAYLPAMVESGELKTSNAGVPDEVPMLWFSANQSWEPTATKMVGNSRGTALIKLTFDEQVEKFGCVRFGLLADDSRLLEWKNACVAAGTAPKKKRAMEQVGRRQGANPAHWYAVTDNIPLDGLLFQVFANNGWCNIDWQGQGIEAMAEKWTEARGRVIQNNPTAA